MEAALGILPIVFIMTVMCAVLLLRERGQRLKPPWVTFVLAAITLVIGSFAVFDDALLDVLRRDAERLAAGEWWRIVSPLVGQDSGLPGLFFNVIVLVFVGGTVENLFGPWLTLGLYLGAGLVSEVAAYTILPGQGFAGNSVACFGLAGLVIVWALLADWPIRLFGIIGTVAALVIIAMGDLHGVGLTVGALTAVVYWGVRKSKTRPRMSARRAAPGSSGVSRAGS
jgi:membrane associated rhomboid family serine protease